MFAMSEHSWELRFFLWPEGLQRRNVAAKWEELRAESREREGYQPLLRALLHEMTKYHIGRESDRVLLARCEGGIGGNDNRICRQIRFQPNCYSWCVDRKEIVLSAQDSSTESWTTAELQQISGAFAAVLSDWMYRHSEVTGTGTVLGYLCIGATDFEDAEECGIARTPAHKKIKRDHMAHMALTGAASAPALYIALRIAPYLSAQGHRACQSKWQEVRNHCPEGVVEAVVGLMRKHNIGNDTDRVVLNRWEQWGIGSNDGRQTRGHHNKREGEEIIIRARSSSDGKSEWTVKELFQICTAFSTVLTNWMTTHTDVGLHFDVFNCPVVEGHVRSDVVSNCEEWEIGVKTPAPENIR
jgi:hypothetical protein